MLLRGVDSSWQSFLGPFNYCAGSTKKEGLPYSLTFSVHPTMSALGQKRTFFMPAQKVRFRG